MSTQGICVMKRWLSDCIDMHAASCDGHLELPSRLIRIETNAEKKFVPHLIDIERVTAGRPLSYAALSYCWGDHGNSFTTFMSNLENIKHVSGWPKNVAKTIQDAI